MISLIEYMTNYASELYIILLFWVNSFTILIIFGLLISGIVKILGLSDLFAVTYSITSIACEFLDTPEVKIKVDDIVK